MAKRNDLKKILIIGSGPIVIGQAGEFDYSATQAIAVLKELGYETVLVNSNPSAIVTDPELSDATYIEPLNLQRLVEIIEKERPDALLPNLGGQAGLNLCSELYNSGILDQYKVQIIGMKAEAIEKGEDRISFKSAMHHLNIDMVRSEPAYTVEEAEKIAEDLGYPVVVRAAYTLGGAGGGLVYNSEELKTIVSNGISASIVGQVLVEQSVLGWQELELEVLRDGKNNKITVCFIENIDPMGIHTGDSVACTPMLTVPADMQKKLEEISFKIAEELDIVGGANIRFAHDPASGRIVVIEINPRASRTSAFSSKAVGLPISRVSALLAVGITLDEISDSSCGTLLKFKPESDSVAVRFPRWDFDRYQGAADKLGTQMRAVGDVIGIGKTYKEALQKAVRSLETGRNGLGGVSKYSVLSAEELLDKLREPTSERHFIIYEALKKNALVADIEYLTKINSFFLNELKELAFQENKIQESGKNITESILKEAKKNGFSDSAISDLTGLTEEEVRGLRKSFGIEKSYAKINNDIIYSTYDSCDETESFGVKNKVIILGSGPNRIGQGTEFDYATVHAAKTFSSLGFETIIVNCNPEAVSTDFSSADKIYLEPLTFEDVISIYEKEKPVGVAVQFGGKAALDLSVKLEKHGVKLLGTETAAYHLSSDRSSLSNTLNELGIKMPELGIAKSAMEALTLSEKIGYPLMVRPLYAGSKTKTEVIYDEVSLKELCLSSNDISLKNPLLIERFLNSAFEIEADAVCDGETVFIPAVMEHIELAGVHSGDSACVLPSGNLSKELLETVEKYTKLIAKSFSIKGIFNIEFAIQDGTLYVLEVRFGASRTVPFVAKTAGVNLASLAAKILTMPILGNPSPIAGLSLKSIPHCGVKEAVFPFSMLPNVDPLLGPEMRSTGSVFGIGATLEEAYSKAQEATGISLPKSGTVFISVNERDKEEIVNVAKDFEKAGFHILATGGTFALLNKNGISAKRIDKLKEGRPNIYDAIVNKQVDLVINTPADIKSSVDDDSYIRKAAIKYNINYITTVAAAKVAVKAISSKAGCVKSIQEYLKGVL